MEVRVEESVPARRLAAIEHSGPYEQIGEKFDQLREWAKETQIGDGTLIAVYYDDPNAVAPDQLRSAACLEVDGYDSIGGGLVKLIDLPGGRYAVATFKGYYHVLGRAWNEFYATRLPALGHRPDPSRPAFEIYIVGCDDSRRSAEPVTDLYAPILPDA